MTVLGFCVPGNLFPLRPENSGNLLEAFVRIIMLKINRKTEKKGRCWDHIDQFTALSSLVELNQVGLVVCKVTIWGSVWVGSGRFWD